MTLETALNFVELLVQSVKYLILLYWHCWPWVGDVAQLGGALARYMRPWVQSPLLNGLNSKQKWGQTEVLTNLSCKRELRNEVKVYWKCRSRDICFYFVFGWKESAHLHAYGIKVKRKNNVEKDNWASAFNPWYKKEPKNRTTNLKEKWLKKQETVFDFKPAKGSFFVSLFVFGCGALHMLRIHTLSLNYPSA